MSIHDIIESCKLLKNLTTLFIFASKLSNKFRFVLKEKIKKQSPKNDENVLVQNEFRNFLLWSAP